jgi:hypothetical protein
MLSHEADEVYFPVDFSALERIYAFAFARADAGTPDPLVKCCVPTPLADGALCEHPADNAAAMAEPTEKTILAFVFIGYPSLNTCMNQC